MPTVQVQNPALLEAKNVDSNGKIYLGKDWAGKRVTLIIEDEEEE